MSGRRGAVLFRASVPHWSAQDIVTLNAGAKLPATVITVCHRAEGAGTMFIFLGYLGKVSPEWKTKVGVKASVNWPAGVGGKGNEGVAGLIKQTPGSIGYVELIYALQNSISYGAVQTQAGEFITGNVNSVTAAAAGALANMPKDFRVSITNAPGPGAYPISSFTWILMYETPKDVAQAKIMSDFMKWALGDGQQLAPALGYAPRPAGRIQQGLARLARNNPQ